MVIWMDYEYSLNLTVSQFARLEAVLRGQGFSLPEFVDSTERVLKCSLSPAKLRVLIFAMDCNGGDSQLCQALAELASVLSHYKVGDPVVVVTIPGRGLAPYGTEGRVLSVNAVKPKYKSIRVSFDVQEFDRSYAAYDLCPVGDTSNSFYDRETIISLILTD